MITYLSWWYIEEPTLLWRAIIIITKKVFASFSVVLLLRTLFDPWKKDILSAENVSLDVRFKIWVNNLISRFIGFIVRLGTILVGLILTVLTFIILIIGFFLWLVMPMVIIIFFFNGIRMIFNG